MQSASQSSPQSKPTRTGKHWREAIASSGDIFSIRHVRVGDGGVILAMVRACWSRNEPRPARSSKSER